MASAFIGQIQLFGFNFAPRGWALCNGQILSIAQNTALFSILGTTYGGDGRTTFGLPDLRGRAAVHMGQGPGLSDYQLGQNGGEPTHTLLASEMPAHTHGMQASTATTALLPAPPNNVLAGANIWAAPASLTSLAPETIASTGGGQPHENMSPYQAVSYCICLQGIFPSRN